MKKYWIYILGLLSGIIFTGTLFTSNLINFSEIIEIISALGTIFGFGAILFQIENENDFRKKSIRPIFTSEVRMGIDVGDDVLSKADQLDFNKYTKNITALNINSNSLATNVLAIASYKNANINTHQEYLFMPVLTDSVLLDFNSGMGFNKLEIYFQTTYGELGCATFRSMGVNTSVPQYNWNQKEIGIKSKPLYEKVNSYHIYRFNENDLNGFKTYVNLQLKQNTIDFKTPVIREVLYGEPHKSRAEILRNSNKRNK